jgi:hypothetical protein
VLVGAGAFTVSHLTDTSFCSASANGAAAATLVVLLASVPSFIDATSALLTLLAVLLMLSLAAVGATTATFAAGDEITALNTGTTDIVALSLTYRAQHIETNKGTKPSGTHVSIQVSLQRCYVCICVWPTAVL